MRLAGFHHAALSVPDLDAAIGWYGAVLGLAVEREWEIADARAASPIWRGTA